MNRGNRIFALRKEKKITQKQLADFLNLSPGTVSNYENGVHSIDLETVDKLADFFGVTTDFLLGRTTYRCSPELLDSYIHKDLVLREIADVMLTLDPESRNQIVEFARFLAYQRKKPEN